MTDPRHPVSGRLLIHLGEGDRCSGVRETLESAKQAAERRLQ